MAKRAVIIDDDANILPVAGSAEGKVMSKRILVIDDEEHIRRMMRLTLEAAGYTVGEASDGNEAIKLYGDGSRWDGVVLDQRMPGLDGLEVLRRIKESDAHARVVMATAYASIELAVDAMKLGASDFIRKPMTPEILRDAVTAALAESRPTGPSETAIDAGIPEKPVIHTITMNGFEILRPSEERDDENIEPGERHFIVTNPRGWQREVVVEIADEVMAYAQRITSRQLPPENSFWTYRAERVLATYLWNEGRFPDERLTVRDLSPEELDIAARWEHGES